jgi:hypothetical protein
LTIKHCLGLTNSLLNSSLFSEAAQTICANALVVLLSQRETAHLETGGECCITKNKVRLLEVLTGGASAP